MDRKMTLTLLSVNGGDERAVKMLRDHLGEDAVIPTKFPLYLIVDGNPTEFKKAIGEECNPRDLERILDRCEELAEILLTLSND